MASPVSWVRNPLQVEAKSQAGTATVQNGQHEAYVGAAATPEAAPPAAAPAPVAPRINVAQLRQRVSDAVYVGTAIAGAVVGAAARAAHKAISRLHPAPEQSAGGPAAPMSLEELKKLPDFNMTVPTRDEAIARLKSGKPLKMLIIGGGATGSGAALDAVGRGIGDVALVEAGDFASGTSSRSTKLIHGGVRYLEKAVKQLDREQYDLVHEGLQERKQFMHVAPHLTDTLRLLTPCYSRFSQAVYFVGLTLYDWIAGKEGLEATRWVSAKEAKREIPSLKTEGLKGAIEYADGEFNDSRMAVGLATTAAAKGATVANYVQVEKLVKDESGKVVGAELKDKLTGDTFTVHADVVINATGPAIDKIRKMDDPNARELSVMSAGTHIVYHDSNPSHRAMLVPETPDGSVAFEKKWEGDNRLFGTTEEPTAIPDNPQTTKERVEYLRTLANQYRDADHQIQPGDIQSVWTGTRPLVRDPKKAAEPGATESLARTHIIEVSPGGLVTIGGGKWTSYGRMAEETVDTAMKQANMPFVPSSRKETQIIGAQGYTPELGGQLAQAYGLDADVAEHLAKSYGNQAIRVADLAREQGLGKRLAEGHPYIEAEVVFGAKHESAVTPVDVLSRRTRLSFVDEAATRKAIPRVVDLMAQTLGWDDQKKAAELQRAEDYYGSNGKAALT